MNTNLSTLFSDLMALCERNEAFYYVDQYDTNGTQYRVFTYRLASYTDFQNRNATECRGHTFRKDGDEWKLASLPMQKFFNFGEHLGWGTEMDLSSISMVMDKLDGSLISTVQDVDGHFFLKSKTSFTSQQVKEATQLLNTAKYANFKNAISHHTAAGRTVNMEYCSPSNQIVIGYSEPMLKVLNVRCHNDGSYLSYDRLLQDFGEDFVVKTHELPSDPKQFMLDAEKMTGIEGFVVCFANGLWVKHKTDAYCTLHHLKDSINNARRLWEACVNETADDLRALFHEDPISIAKIIDMEEKASSIFNHIHKTVFSFYEENKHLDRKEYAIKGQDMLAKDGTFSLAMNAYLNKEVDIKAFMVKNYKKYGVTDEEVVNE